MNKINFVDLKSQNKHLNYAEIVSCIEEAQFVGGRALETFEHAFASYIGTKYCVGVGSGTDALWLSLLAMGIGPGDDVIVPANTFIATAMAVSHTGADVVFCDVDPNTYLMTPAEVEKVITPKTKALIPVHLYGQACEMEELIRFSHMNGLLILEDCAQSAGAYNGVRKTGAFGTAGAFSFYPAKNLGGLGQGGAVTTDNEIIANKVRSLGNIGRKMGSHFDFDLLGMNSRLDTVNAIFLNQQLKELDERNISRAAAAQLYSLLLTETDKHGIVVCPKVAKTSTHVYHLYELKCPNREFRDVLMAALRDKDIFSGLHYPVPCHKQPVYASHNDVFLPVVEDLADTLVSLPMHPFLKPKEVEDVVDVIRGLVF